MGNSFKLRKNVPLNVLPRIYGMHNKVKVDMLKTLGMPSEKIKKKVLDICQKGGRGYPSEKFKK